MPALDEAPALHKDAFLKTFASDNYAGVHPQIMESIVAANAGDAKAYGEDLWTQRADEQFRRHFGSHVEVFYVFNGTGANVLGLQSLLKPHQALICSETAHIVQDECGAPTRYTGSTTLLVPTGDGKLRPTDLSLFTRMLGVQHQVQPQVVSITQPTEYGTLYTVEEIGALADFCHAQGWVLQMDGARLCNAAAALNLDFKTFTTDAGVDVLSFGGTKNGLMLGEAVLFLNPDLALQAKQEFKYLRKQAMQLASKMRFIACQFEMLLQAQPDGDFLGLTNARHANAMAQRLAEGVQKLIAKFPDRLQLTQPVQANGVFVKLSPEQVGELQAVTPFYIWKTGKDGFQEVRWMCAYDTTPEDVDRFLRLLQTVCC